MEQGFLGTIGWIKSNLMSNPDLQDKGYNNENFYPGAENIPESRPSAKPFKLEPRGATIDDNGIATFNTGGEYDKITAGLRILDFPDLKGKGFVWTVRFMTGTQTQLNNIKSKALPLITWNPKSMVVNTSNTREALKIGQYGDSKGYKAIIDFPAYKASDGSYVYGSGSSAFPVSAGDNSATTYFSGTMITPQTWYDAILDYNIETPQKVAFTLKNLTTGERYDKLMNIHSSNVIDMNRNGDIIYFLGGSTPQVRERFYQAIDTKNTTIKIK